MAENLRGPDRRADGSPHSPSWTFLTRRTRVMDFRRGARLPAGSVGLRAGVQRRPSEDGRDLQDANSRLTEKLKRGLRGCQQITISTFRQEFIIPVAMKPVSPEFELGHLLIADLDSRGIDVGVEFAFHCQTCGGGCSGDEVDDDLDGQRLATPVLANEREESRSFHLLVPGGKSRDCQPGFLAAAVPIHKRRRCCRRNRR